MKLLTEKGHQNSLLLSKVSVPWLAITLGVLQRAALQQELFAVLSSNAQLHLASRYSVSALHHIPIDGLENAEINVLISASYKA